MDEKYYTPQEVAIEILNKAREMLKNSKLAKANTAHEVEDGGEPRNDDAECPDFLAAKGKKDKKDKKKQWDKDAIEDHENESDEDSDEDSDGDEADDKDRHESEEYDDKDAEKIIEDAAQPQKRVNKSEEAGSDQKVSKKEGVPKEADASVFERCVKDVKKNPKFKAKKGQSRVGAAHAVCAASGAGRGGKMHKADNPDAKADAALGEKIEHDVEQHMSDNKQAERKEGDIKKKYIGFKNLKEKLKRKGYSEKYAEDEAADIGRAKYGKKKFQHAAAAGKKMKGMKHKKHVKKSEDRIQENKYVPHDKLAEMKEKFNPNEPTSSGKLKKFLMRKKIKRSQND